jgi:hypothetical protein
MIYLHRAYAVSTSEMKMTHTISSPTMRHPLQLLQSLLGQYLRTAGAFQLRIGGQEGLRRVHNDICYPALW